MIYSEAIYDRPEYIGVDVVYRRRRGQKENGRGTTKRCQSAKGERRTKQLKRFNEGVKKSNKKIVSTSEIDEESGGEKEPISGEKDAEAASSGYNKC